jgi:hypothetical protein
MLKMSQCLEGFCHHSIACPQVADVGDSVQIYRIAAIIDNKQLLTDSRQWVVLQPGFWLWEHKLTTKKKQFVMKCYAGTQTLMDSLNDICKGKWT